MAKVARNIEIKRDASGEEYLEVAMDGAAILRVPMLNKGTAFTDEERRALGIDGLLPPGVIPLDRQIERVYRAFLEQRDDISKYQYLRQLQERHETLFYALLERHLTEMLPIVYTPTVGEAVRRFHTLYQSARGLSLSPKNIERADEVFANYPWEDVRMIVATDSSAILGIGDQGYGGLGICIGKLALYTAGGGVSPVHTLPVALDVGTEREDLLDDPLYLGVRRRRMKGEEYLAFVDAFVEATKRRFPRAVIQWEDLAKDTAFTVLERFRDRVPSFNDDIQGTGAVALAGVLSACRLRGEALRDQRIVIHGAGAGGVGVALALYQGLLHEGLTADEARARIFVLDSKGLLTSDRSMEDYKRVFAHDPKAVSGFTKRAGAPSLVETIAGARATVLLGLSGQPGAFGEAEVRAMCEATARPIIFPLSNPTSSCEAAPADILRWSEGRAVVATGSPFAPVDVNGTPVEIGQGNNAFIFPGLGFGAILSNARRITDAMVAEGAYALADYTAERYPERVYPPVDALREVSIRVATRVIRRAIEDGVADAPEAARRDPETFVREKAWRPRHLLIRRAE